MIAYSLETRITASSSPTPPHIYVTLVNGTATTDLTPGDGRWNEYPAWTSDGAELVFESYAPTTHQVHETQSIHLDGTGRRKLPTDVRPYIAYAAVATSVREFVYTGPDSAGTYGVLLSRNLDDGTGITVRQLTTYLPPDSGLSTAPWQQSTAVQTLQ
jgi:Tol biopolymer transport system component